MLFRIENTSGDNIRSSYDPEDYSFPVVVKADIDQVIASMIRSEVNGAADREILSYSKSLAACILKYNKYADNELHIFEEGLSLDSILYEDSKRLSRDPYQISGRVYCGSERPYFEDSGEITLRDFVIDISDNELLDSYLRMYTGTGRKLMASPEKDSEVVVMNPNNDLVIEQYAEAVYTLYALQYRYRFLQNPSAHYELISKIVRLHDGRFACCEDDERRGIIDIINYLACCWNYEYSISQGIYEYFRASENFLPAYNPVYEFDSIVNEDFDEAYRNSDYNGNIVSELCWRICYRTINGYYLRGEYFDDEDLI